MLVHSVNLTIVNFCVTVPTSVVHFTFTDVVSQVLSVDTVTIEAKILCTRINENSTCWSTERSLAVAGESITISYTSSAILTRGVRARICQGNYSITITMKALKC